MHIRTLVAEDEKPARDRLILSLKAMPDITVIGEAVNGAQAVELIHSLKPQLAFLDIQMPLLNGFEVLQRCKHMPMVIFTTAYDEYALRAFEVHAIDYLLKPYDKERLRSAVEHVVERYFSKNSEPGQAGLSELISDYRKKNPYLSRLSVRQGGTYRVVPVEQADYFKAENGLVFFVDGNRRILVEETLSSLEENLDPASFLRIHRNTIANLAKISRVVPLGRGRYAAEFPGGVLVEVGRTKNEEFRRAMRLK